MASEPTIDLDRLLQPISDDSPSGPALKDDAELSSHYYAVKDASGAARSAERAYLMAGMGDEDPDAPSPDPPDWDAVIRLASDALAERSKDLWIAAWLIEGLARKHGFAGLRDGFRLTREIAQRYWDTVHPRPDEDGVATTVAQLTGLNGDGSDGALLAPIAAIPLTTEGESVRPLSGRDYVDAAELDSKDADYRARKIDEGAVSLEDFEKASRETPPAFFENLREDILAAREEFEQLTQTLDELCGEGPGGYSAAPPSSAIQNALVAAEDQLRAIAGDAIGGAPSEEASSHETADDSPAESEAGVARPAARVDEINSREAALKALTKVAEYFRRTEPHSPVSYSLEQAVRWGRMSLPELMGELVTDNSARRDLFKLAGIPMQDDDDD